MANKVCVIGRAVCWRNAPFDDDSFEFWGMGSITTAHDLDQFTRWYEVHNYEDVKKDGRVSRNFKLLRDYPEKFWVLDERFTGANRIEYMASSEPSFYLTGTPAYVLNDIYAMPKPPAEVHLYGVVQNAAHEYASQRVGTQHFLRLLKQIGVKVTVHGKTTLLEQNWPSYPMGGAWLT